jgi:hypothetical protein
MGSRIVCCFVLYSAFDSKIMQLANRRPPGSIQFDGLSATLPCARPLGTVQAGEWNGRYTSE